MKNKIKIILNDYLSDLQLLSELDKENIEGYDEQTKRVNEILKNML